MKRLLLSVCLFLCGSGALAQQAQEKNLSKHVYTLASDSLRGRMAGSEYGKQAAEYIFGHFQAAGMDNVSYQEFQWNGKWCRNVVGTIYGNDPSLEAEYVVIGAHYDHLGVKNERGETVVYNGADDNASGIAAILELAQKLVKNRTELKRSVILIAFDAEEQGLWGSKHFTEKSGIEPGKIKLMLSIDMVGMLEQGGRLQYAGTGMLREGTKLFARHLPGNDSLTVKYKAFDTFLMGGSDHDPFASLGIPALHVSTGLKSPYLKPTDDAERLDYAGLSKVTDHLYDVTRFATESDQVIPSGKRSFKHFGTEPKITFGVSLSVGSNKHQYTSGALTGKTAFAGNAGLYSNIRLGTFFLRPEVQYERRHAQHPLGEFHTDALSIPVTFGIALPQTSPIQFYIGVGGYYNYAFAGHAGNQNINFNTDYYPHEGGITWTLGLKLYKMSIAYTAKYGLTPLIRHPAVSNFKNQTNYFSIYYTLCYSRKRR